MNGERAPFDQMANGERQTQRNPKYRTKLCRNFPLGRCRYGEDCSYLHVSTVPSSSASFSPFSNYAVVAQSLYQPYNPFLFNEPMYVEPPAPAKVLESRADTRVRGSRGDAPRRPSRTPPAQTSHVEKWRLTVDTAKSLRVTLPPAPPTTPTSASMPDSPTPTDHERRSPAGRRAQDPMYRTESVRSGRGATAVPHRAQKRNQFFRTKPCRFFAEPTGCVKGDRCNFMHEAPDHGRLPTGLAVAAEVMSEGEEESAADSSVQGELSPSTAATSEAPTCSSVTAEDQKTNFYPVTWRVVGGGVTLGGKREVCENFMMGRCSEGVDCKYAHPETNEDEDDSVYGYPEAPMFSPISPISPVLVPYPVMYPFVPSIQAFAFPSLPTGLPMAAPSAIQTAPTPKAMHRAKKSLTLITPAAQPVAMPQAYSPHRIVDGSTLLDREPPAGMYRPDGIWAARSVVRPLSTPPTPVHGPDVGVARLFAAEMP
ncbi:hypothetical protein VTO73DRAFT_5814 [Trametes versicolor]